MPPPQVALLLPTLWDRRQLAACREVWSERLALAFLGPEDADVPSDLDVPALVDALARAHPGLAGVTSSSDYPGAVAAALLAQRLATPGADPRAVLACGHKAQARAHAARVAPEVVPWFRRLEAGANPRLPEGLRYPCFVKPARGSFSLLARRVEDEAALREFLAHPSVRAHARSYVAIHRDLARALGDAGPDAGEFLAEGVLVGPQVTLEGWVGERDVHVLGVVDSVMHPGTHAFAAFETPSALPAAVQERMVDVVRRVVPALGLRRTCFNAEFTWDPATDRVGLVEVNPRLAGQFADLWQKTLGVNGYEIALALALGEPPPAARGGRFVCAASVPLRTFTPVRVERAPDAQRIAAVERAFPGTQVWWECAEGDLLDGFDAAGEGQGYRYGVINLGADTRADLATKASAVMAALGARLRPA